MGVSGDAHTQLGQPSGQVPPDFEGSKQPSSRPSLAPPRCTEQQISLPVQQYPPQQRLGSAQTGGAIPVAPSLHRSAKQTPVGSPHGAATHSPWRQTGAAAEQDLSQLPQWCGSLINPAHVPLQHAESLPQAGLQSHAFPPEPLEPPEALAPPDALPPADVPPLAPPTEAPPFAPASRDEESVETFPAHPESAMLRTAATEIAIRVCWTMSCCVPFGDLGSATGTDVRRC
jgi:hypothetical protein